MSVNNIDSTCADGIPMPIVTLNRVILLTGVTVALVTQQAWIIGLLALLVLPAVVAGRRWSPIFRLGSVLLASRLPGAEQEDPRLMRFNNSIALTLLGSASLALFAGLPVVGWVLAAMVAVASAVALLGFCLGCFLYFQFRINRTRLFQAARRA